MARSGSNTARFRIAGAGPRIRTGFARWLSTRRDGALEKNATVSKEKKFTVLSFPMENGTAYDTSVKGYINDQGLVERVETMIDNGMLGDTKWEATFSNYKDFGGVKV